MNARGAIPAVVAVASVLAVGVLSPFPVWTVAVAAAVVGVASPILVDHYRATSADSDDGSASDRTGSTADRNGSTTGRDDEK